MMSKRAHREDMNRRFEERMMESAQIEVVTNGDTWQVRCYDSKGFWMGGISGLPMEEAAAEAHRFCIAAPGMLCSAL